MFLWFTNVCSMLSSQIWKWNSIRKLKLLISKLVTLPLHLPATRFRKCFKVSFEVDTRIHVFFLLLADVRRCKSGMDLILASLNLETAFSVYKSGYFSKDGMKYFSERRVYRLHRDILHSLGVVVRDVKRVGKWCKTYEYLNIFCLKLVIVS